MKSLLLEISNGFVLLAVIVLGGAAAFYMIYEKGKNDKILQKRVSEAATAYNAALNGNSKVGALNAGRRYYTLLRNGSLMQVDEIQIMNDVNARENLH